MGHIVIPITHIGQAKSLKSTLVFLDGELIAQGQTGVYIVRQSVNDRNGGILS